MIAFIRRWHEQHALQQRDRLGMMRALRKSGRGTIGAVLYGCWKCVPGLEDVRFERVSFGVAHCVIVFRLKWYLRFGWSISRSVRLIEQMLEHERPAGVRIDVKHE